MKLNKVIAMALVATAALGFTACGGAKGSAELYSTQSDFVEAGYEGDCVNTTQQILVLSPDGTYTYEDDFQVHQISGVIVANNRTVYKGKYTAGDADADGVKEISLEAPTEGYVSMNGAVTPSSDDAEFLGDFDKSSVKVNVNEGVIVTE